MKLTVTGRNIEITGAIKSYLDSKMNKAFQGMNESIDVHVSLHVQKYRHMAEITVKIKGFTAHADEETDDLYISMGRVLEKIEKQLKKYKGREKNKKIKNGSEVKNILNA